MRHVVRYISIHIEVSEKPAEYMFVAVQKEFPLRTGNIDSLQIDMMSYSKTPSSWIVLKMVKQDRPKHRKLVTNLHVIL
jgi:hypothetical protein